MGATGATMYAVGTGISMWQQQQGAEDSADAMLDADKHNRAMAKLDMEHAYYKSKTSEGILREKGEIAKGDATLAAGSGGFATDSKSNMDVLESIDRSIELDAAVIRQTGDIEARSIQSEAEIRSKNTQDLAKNTKKAGYLDSYTTMLQGGATAYQLWDRGSKTRTTKG